MPYWSASRSSCSRMRVIRVSRSSRTTLMKVTSPSTRRSAQRRVQRRGELDIRRLDRSDALIEAQRVLDPVAGKGVDDGPLLVGSDDFLRRVFQIEDTLVDADDGVDERRLEVQAGLRHDVNRPAEPDHERLFGLRYREDRAVGNDHQQEQQDQGDNTCDGRDRKVPPPCCWPVVGAGRRGVSSLSGRYGTTLCAELPPS